MGGMIVAAAPQAQADPVPKLGVAHPYEYAEGFGTVRPVSFSLVSTASSTVQKITWDSWGGPQAIGHGLNPDGAGNPMVPVTVTAFDLGPCNGQLVYRQVMRTPPGGSDAHNICHGSH
jgi:hypothetical protein